MPARPGVPVAADFSVTAKLAGSVATGMEGVTVRLVAVAWRPTASVVDAEMPNRSRHLRDKTRCWHAPLSAHVQRHTQSYLPLVHLTTHKAGDHVLVAGGCVGVREGDRPVASVVPLSVVPSP